MSGCCRSLDCVGHIGLDPELGVERGLRAQPSNGSWKFPPRSGTVALLAGSMIGLGMVRKVFGLLDVMNMLRLIVYKFIYITHATL
jgi:hypothetical protein